MTPHRQRSGRPSARRGGGARGAGAAARTPPPSSRVCLRAGPTPTSLRLRPPRPPGRRSGPGSTAATTSSTACLCASQVPGPGRAGVGARAGPGSGSLCVWCPRTLGVSGSRPCVTSSSPSPCAQERGGLHSPPGPPAAGGGAQPPPRRARVLLFSVCSESGRFCLLPPRPPLPSFLGLVDSSGLREKMTVLSLPGELRDGSEQKKRCLFSVFR